MDIKGINGLQKSIMFFIKDWVEVQKTPVPKKEIIRHMEQEKVKSYTASNAINSLLVKGYIRKAYSYGAKSTLYVMIRNI